MPVFRVAGLHPQDPQVQTILDRHAGSIRQFYRKAASASEAGFIPHEHMVEDRGDHKLRYQRLAGQEVVTVTPVLKSAPIPKKSGGEDPWRWVLIDVEIPNIATTDVRNAVVKALRKLPPATDADLAYDGYAFDRGEVNPDVGAHDTSDGMSKPVLAFAPRDDRWLPIHAPIEAVVSKDAGGTQIASLRIDMRDKVAIPVVVELWGYLMAYVPGFQRTQGRWHMDLSPETELSISGGVYTPAVESIWGYFGKEGDLITQDSTDAAPEFMYNLIPDGGSVTDGDASPNGTTAAYYGTPALHTFGTEPIPARKAKLRARPLSPTPVPIEEGGYNFMEARYHSSGLISSVTWYRLLAGVPLFVPETQSFFIETYTITTPVVSGAVLGFPDDPISRDITIKGVGGFIWPDWTVELQDFPGFTYNADVPELGTARWVSSQSERKTEVGHAAIRADAALGGDYALLGTIIINPIEHAIVFEPAPAS